MTRPPHRSSADGPLLDHLQDGLDAVQGAAWNLIGFVDPPRRETYVRALAGLSEGWRRFAARVEGDQRERLGNAIATALAQIGDDLFYGRGHADDAIAAFDLALSIAPAHAEALKGIIAAFLQGSRRRLVEALPYAERLAEADPARQTDVEYIRSLIGDE